jgi:hypothetical protein
LDADAKEYLIMVSNLSIRVLVNYLEKVCIIKGNQWFPLKPPPSTATNEIETMCFSSDLSVKEESVSPLTLPECKEICSNISHQQFELYISLVKQNKLSEAIDILYKIHDYGYSVIDILDYFFAFIKTTTLLDEETKYRYIPFLCKYITIFHNVHEDGIELALFTNAVKPMISPITT